MDSTLVPGSDVSGLSSRLCTKQKVFACDVLAFAAKNERNAARLGIRRGSGRENAGSTGTRDDSDAATAGSATPPSDDATASDKESARAMRAGVWRGMIPMDSRSS
ncbi:hypothetical protein [Paracidovorax oryzae]|uniref:hypothetical protein n=1 Tax=Paracidovorax oryzae TaxID=862720 RepID=UPI0035D0127B